MGALDNFTITSIESVRFYDNGKELTNKNIPDYTKVSHMKFKKFCRNKDLNCRSNTMLERTGFFDEYDNLVAYYVWGRKSNNSDAEYYINPKLYELSQEQKQRIKNEYTQVREPALIATLDDVKSMKIK